ncbi:MAG: hypothetical protein WD749_05135 [Phycisphaerales bacterium]
MTAPAAHPEPAAFSIPFERRAHKRDDRSGSAMAAFYDASGDLTLCPVTLVDRSCAGLGVLCEIAAAPGSRFTLYGSDLPVPHMQGVVARCDRAGRGFRLGLRCDARLAA